MPWPTVLWVILVDWVMIVTGLVGALVKSIYKWGYFAFGTPNTRSRLPFRVKEN
jgi:bacteriorhodopsin